MLCMFSSVVASEALNENQKNFILLNTIVGIQAQVSINQDRYDWYQVIDSDHQSIKHMDLEKAMQAVKVTSIETLGNIVSLKGLGSSEDNNFRIIFEDKAIDVFRKIKALHEVQYKDFSYIYLAQNKEDKLSLFSLGFTKDQVKEILDEKSYSSGQIITIVGFAGLATFLICYFNLYSKGMALLGRG